MIQDYKIRERLIRHIGLHSTLHINQSIKSRLLWKLTARSLHNAYSIRVAPGYLYEASSECQKQPPEVFYKKRCSWKLLKIHSQKPLLESLFNEVTGLKSTTLLKKRLRHRCFSANLTKFLTEYYCATTSPEIPGWLTSLIRSLLQTTLVFSCIFLSEKRSLFKKGSFPLRIFSLVTFIGEILNGKIHFLCSVI